MPQKTRLISGDRAWWGLNTGSATRAECAPKTSSGAQCIDEVCNLSPSSASSEQHTGQSTQRAWYLIKDALTFFKFRPSQLLLITLLPCHSVTLFLHHSAAPPVRLEPNRREAAQSSGSYFCGGAGGWSPWPPSSGRCRGPRSFSMRAFKYTA